MYLQLMVSIYFLEVARTTGVDASQVQLLPEFVVTSGLCSAFLSTSWMEVLVGLCSTVAWVADGRAINYNVMAHIMPMAGQF